MANLVLILVFLGFCSCQRGKNNVCSRLIDYLAIDLSPNCRYNPDVGAYPDEVANRYGYPFESHKVITEDGYILRVMRIPRDGKRPVFIQHGVLATGSTWVGLGNNSLAFRLYDEGYDVWFGSFRGTFFSNEHVDPNIPKDKYWDFSWDEMGFYDLPAMLNFTAAHSKSTKKIIYIGHSMGTTTSYVYSILRRTEAEERLAAIVSLAPVAYMRGFNRAISAIAPFGDTILVFSRLINLFYIGPKNTEELVVFFKACLYGATRLGCEIVTTSALALTGSSISPEILPIFMTWSPTATALKTLNHYGQEINNGGQFRAYDYGSRNQEVYSSPQPPLYNVSEITLPVYLFYGKRDTLGDEEDVLQLYADLTSRKFITPIAENDEVQYNHFDFVYGSQIQYLYNPLFRTLNQINNEIN